MEQEFDYSLVDNNTADFLRSCEYEMNGIAEDARVRFGGVLKKAQDKLANNQNGVFQKWVKSGGISLNDAYYYIKLNMSSRNLGDMQKDNFLKAPKSLQIEVMKKNAPEDLREKVYNGDITTHKEYKRMKKQSREKNEANFNKNSLYIIKHKGFDNYYKIGISSDFVTRLKSITTYSPLGVEIIYTNNVDSTSHVENIVHSKYGNRRCNGEWFNFDKSEIDGVINYIENLIEAV